MMSSRNYQAHCRIIAALSWRSTCDWLLALLARACIDAVPSEIASLIALACKSLDTFKTSDGLEEVQAFFEPPERFQAVETLLSTTQKDIQLRLNSVCREGLKDLQQQVDLLRNERGQ